MLCKVMQTEMTLKTGDHSLPRIEAQILAGAQVRLIPTVEFCASDTYMAIGVHLLNGDVSEAHSRIFNSTYWMYRCLICVIIDKLNSRR